LQSPIDQHEYDPARHPPKPPEIIFDVPVYYETVAFVTMTGVEHREPFRKLRVDFALFDESRS
jgi:hypothetical protein